MITELRCSDMRELLGAHLDGELSSGQTAAVVHHFEGCAACASELDQMARARERTRRHMPGMVAPDLLRARIRAGLRDGAPDLAMTRHARWRTWAAFVGVGAFIAILSSASTVWLMRPRPNRGEPAGEQVLASHMRALTSYHWTDVTSGDPHIVKPWFNGRVDFSPTVRGLDADGFPLAGGRLDSAGIRRVAVIVYGRRLHIINVYTWPANGGAPPADSATTHGYTALHWANAGMTFWAVSDLDVHELRQFIAAFRAEPAPR
jgi:anti-sigma factor RsiW